MHHKGGKKTSIYRLHTRGTNIPHTSPTFKPTRYKPCVPLIELPIPHPILRADPQLLELAVQRAALHADEIRGAADIAAETQ